MVTPTIATSRSRSTSVIRPARSASPNTTNANSPPSASTLPSNSAPRASSRPGRRPSANRIANFTASNASTPASISSGSRTTRARSMLMPTAMKNSPSSSPSNGSIWAWISCRNSESASNTPARNAPRPMLSPASCISQALPSTTSSAVAVNTSGMRVRATIRNRWRSSTRPPSTSAAIAVTAFSTASHSGWAAAGSPACPSSGISASSGIAARSWNSRIANARRPCSLASALRSASSCRPTAVDENASPKPTTSAARQSSPSASAMPPRTTPLTPICRPPTPNTGRRITRNRAGDSSSPITNSSSTTPISLAASTGSASRITRSPLGPRVTPAAR